MKRFFYFSIIALCFLGCKHVEPQKETPIFKIAMLKNSVIAPLINNDTIVIEEFSIYDGDVQFSFEGKIFSDEQFNLEVTTTRNTFAVENKTTDELCIHICEKTQYDTYDENGEFIETVYPVTKNFSAKISDEQEFYTHCSPKVAGNHIITYDFHEKEKPNVKISVTVIYKYHSEN